MAENIAPNNPPSPTTPRTANSQVQAGSGRRHARPVYPDPVIAAPNAPRAAAPPSPTTNQQRLTIAGRILVFFGYGRNNRARKELVSVISSVVVDISQVSIWLAWLSTSMSGLMGRMVNLENRLSRSSHCLPSPHTAEALQYHQKTSGMHVGSHWVHGTPSGSSALPSTFGSASGAGLANVPSASRMKGRPKFGPTFNHLLHVVCAAVVPRPMMLKFIHVIARIVRLRVEGHTAAPHKETRTVQPRRSLKPRPCHTRGSMRGLFAGFLTFAPLSVRTTHYTRCDCV